MVIHNECFADTTSPAYIRRIRPPTTPGAGVVIHCAMHTYRATDIDDWREFLESPAVAMITRAGIRSSCPSPASHPEGHAVRLDHAHGRTVHHREGMARDHSLATSISEVDGKAYPVAWVHDREGPRLRHHLATPTIRSRSRLSIT